MDKPNLNWKEAVVEADGQITVGWDSVPVTYWRTLFIDQLNKMKSEISQQWGGIYMAGKMLTVAGVDPDSVPLLKAFLAEVTDHTFEQLLRQEREREVQRIQAKRDAEAQALRNAELQRRLREG